MVDYGYAFKDEKDNDINFNYIVQYEPPVNMYNFLWTETPQHMDIVYDTERGRIDSKFVQIVGHWLYISEVEEQCNPDWTLTVSTDTAHRTRELNLEKKKPPAEWVEELSKVTIRNGELGNTVLMAMQSEPSMSECRREMALHCEHEGYLKGWRGSADDDHAK